MSKKKAASSSAAALAAGFGFSGFGGVESLQAFVRSRLDIIYKHHA